MPTLRSFVRSAVLRPLREIVPARHRIGYDLLLERATGRLEDELIHLDRITPGGAVAVDVGANQGYYSYALSRRFRRVLSFEPNSGLANELVRTAPPNVEVHNVALSSRPGELDLYVPLVDGVEQHGWASFDRDNLPGARDFRILHVPVRPLDDFMLDGLDFLKIDVEGHELNVLEGARDTLRRNRPVVLIEIREANRATAFEIFAELGFRPGRLRDGRVEPFEGEATGENFVFRPASAGA